MEEGMGEVRLVRREDREHVGRAVWDEFCKLSGRERCASPAEWDVLSKWMDKGIPLPVILRAFGEFKGRPRVLTAMEGPVARAYEYYRQAMAL